jgi:hypothetical protein
LNIPFDDEAASQVVQGDGDGLDFGLVGDDGGGEEFIPDGGKLPDQHDDKGRQRVGVNVYPHRLRHTAATQLLNAGCRVTSIQKFLGHKELNTTMVYARVHDQTVADDYYSAMERVEQRLGLFGEPGIFTRRIDENERGQLIGLVARLAQPELSLEARLEIATLMSRLLSGPEAVPINNYGRKQSDVLEVHPPPSPVLVGVT